MLTKEMEVLVTENMGLAGYMAKRFLNTGIEYRELYSLAYLGLVKAANSFNARKSKFATYAARVMRNEILMFLRQNRRHSLCVSYDALMSQDDNKDNAFLYLFGYEDPELERIENIGMYDFLTEDLSEREKLVVDQVIIGGIFQSDVGRQLGVSQSYISRVERRAVNKMRQKMAPACRNRTRSAKDNQSSAL